MRAATPSSRIRTAATPTRCATGSVVDLNTGLLRKPDRPATSTPASPALPPADRSPWQSGAVPDRVLLRAGQNSDGLGEFGVRGHCPVRCGVGAQDVGEGHCIEVV